MTDNEQVTISAAYFAELWKKANETDNICKECREEHTADEFVAIAKERDELKAKLEDAENREHASDADGIRLGYKCDELSKRLAAAERCIDDVLCEIDTKGATSVTAKICHIRSIIRDYRAKGGKECAGRRER